MPSRSVLIADVPMKIWPSCPGVTDIVITARIGDVIPPAGDKRPSGAMVLACGETREAALTAANAAQALIRVETTGFGEIRGEQQAI